MFLGLDQIREITCGAVRMEQTAGGVRFYRFTQEQHDLYSQKQIGLFEKSQATAGVKLCFKTDSKRLYFKALFENAYSRTYFSVDVFVNGTMIDCLDNYSDQTLPKDYTQINFPVGVYEKTFELGAGMKTVTVHLPWNKKVELQAFGLDDGAGVIPVRPEKKLLAFGDSITQGFDSLRPSRRYVARLADALGAEEFNKAVGAECYFPELAAAKEGFTPDYITVAYGTNDWNSLTPDVFEDRVRRFYTNLLTAYPKAKVFAISPIWRPNWTEIKAFSSFGDIEQGIREATKGADNVTVISGFDLVPHDSDYYGDLRLHPNAEGFDHYFQNLWNKIKDKI